MSVTTSLLNFVVANKASLEHINSLTPWAETLFLSFVVRQITQIHLKNKQYFSIFSVHKIRCEKKRGERERLPIALNCKLQASQFVKEKERERGKPTEIIILVRIILLFFCCWNMKIFLSLPASSAF